MCFVDAPAADETALRARLDAAVGYAADKGRPWFAIACEEWMPPAWRDVVADAGLHVVMGMTGMVADEILPPRRPAPDLVLRRVGDESSRRAVAELHDLAYGLAPGLCDCMVDPAIWQPDLFGSVGSVDGVVVSTATAYPVLGTRYVAMVATRPGHGRKGYAEHVMRHALAQAEAATGARRATLHATDAGRPVYAAMGYEAVARLVLLATDEGG